MKNFKQIFRITSSILSGLVVAVLIGGSFSVMAANAGPDLAHYAGYIGMSVTALSFASAFVMTNAMGDSLNIIDTTWSGPDLDYMITRAVVDVDTIIKGCANVVDGIRKQIRIPRVEVSGLLQAYNPDPIGNGSTTVDAQLLDPQKFELYQEFNPADFEQHYFAEEFTEDRLIDRSLPPTAENYIMLQYMKRLNECFEIDFWQSRIEYNPTGLNVDPVTKGAPDNTVKTNYGGIFYDGFISKALNDATVQQLSPTPLNPGNIRTQMTALKSLLVANEISKALCFKYGPLGMRYFMSYADQQNYEEALRTDLYKNQDSTQTAINRYKGHDIVPLAGLLPNTAFFTVGRPDYASNLWVGVNSEDDVQLEMARKPKPSDLWYVKGIFKVDVNHGFGDQMALTTLMTK